MNMTKENCREVQGIELIIDKSCRYISAVTHGDKP